MDDLARRFEQDRAHLRSVAYRMLGSQSDADDAVQEAWLRLSKTDASTVENLGGWLTTVVARVCLDMLRSRTRREAPMPAPLVERSDGTTPESRALLADSVGAALLVVLDMLEPAERIAFVLHDMFAVPFDEIANIVDRTPAAARKLASRARRRVQGAPVPDGEVARQREVVTAFLAAAHAGDFSALLALLDPDVRVRADRAAVAAGAAGELRGAVALANTVAGRARAARPVLVDGFVGAAWIVDGSPKIVFDMTIVDGKIVEIELIAEPERLDRLEIVDA